MPTIINGLVKIRKGTEAGLASIVLLDGELGFATDTGLIKVGDGVTAFSALTAGYYSKSDVYTKAEVQTIINGLINKINTLTIYVDSFGIKDVSDIDNTGLF